MTYSVREAGSQFSAELVKKVAGNRSLNYQINDVDVLVSKDTTLECADDFDNVSVDNPITVDVTPWRFACDKAGDGSASLIIRTTEGSFEVYLPSKAELARRTAEFEKRKTRPTCAMDQPLPDTNLAGNNISPDIFNVPSHAACRDICASNPDCNAWGYRNDSKSVDFRTCWLKTAKSTETVDNSVISGTKTCN